MGYRCVGVLHVAVTGARRQGAPIRPLAAVRTILVAGVLLIGSTVSALAQSQTPPEIVELARALKHDPDLIYEYVYNNIETLPQYASLKGPLGALLDSKGTAADQ